LFEKKSKRKEWNDKSMGVPQLGGSVGGFLGCQGVGEKKRGGGPGLVL